MIQVICNQVMCWFYINSQFIIFMSIFQQNNFITHIEVLLYHIYDRQIVPTFQVQWNCGSHSVEWYKVNQHSSHSNQFNCETWTKNTNQNEIVWDFVCSRLPGCRSNSTNYSIRFSEWWKKCRIQISIWSSYWMDCILYSKSNWRK